MLSTSNRRRMYFVHLCACLPFGSYYYYSSFLSSCFHLCICGRRDELLVRMQIFQCKPKTLIIMLFQQWSKTDMIKVRFQTYLQLTLIGCVLEGQLYQTFKQKLRGTVGVILVEDFVDITSGNTDGCHCCNMHPYICL